MHEISSFLSRYSEGFGWVVKLPFTTNSHGRHFCLKSGKLPLCCVCLNMLCLIISGFYADNVYNALRNIVSDFGDLYPYAMLQPTLANRKEYKVILLNKKAIYFTSKKVDLDLDFHISSYNLYIYIGHCIWQ